MSAQNSLDRFLEAQSRTYHTALSEIQNGSKTSHWMWYIFPQIKGLGFSEISKLYAIADRAEAISYLGHPVLGARLVEISETLLSLGIRDPVRIFGYTDSMKLKSCMTLFSLLKNTHPVFQQVLDVFFSGEKDAKTVQLLNA